jgi:class 3 adenylate cyclase/tetratricopeptide (TPR) repeat protein
MVTGSFSRGERRQLTIVFSDLVGSTELSARLDPEDWHDIVMHYHRAVTDIVKHFEGHVAQYLGDGVLVLFGYPVAHENDAERAVRAGLALLEEMKSLNSHLEGEYGKRLAVRVGIHTGEVMVRWEAGDSGNIFGETPNIAARVQSLAGPDCVYISAATQRLVAGFFVVDDLGPYVLKGIPDPIRLFRVERITGVRSRLHAATNSSLSPFVGREETRNLLMNRWTQVQKGRGQLVMITGEAGIGKSRLLQQFKEDLGGIPHTWIEGESSPYEQDTPFAPTLDLVQNAFQWTMDTPVAEKIAILERSFSLVGIEPANSVPLLASLFGFEVPSDRYPPLLFSPEQRRVHLLQTLVDWVIGTARLQPTVLVIEDLHFADPSTLEEFVMLGEQMENVPLMLLFTARPQFKPPWPTRSFHTLIHLNRLEPENIRELITGLLGRLLHIRILDSLVMRADGVPLFAEELSHTIAETRNGEALKKQIPATLQDLLMARLDSLGPDKDIAQIGSVIGRDFSFSLFASIAGMAEAELQAALARLTESGLVFEDRRSADSIYTFKHALIQEVAYSSLLKSRRRELHRSIAKVLHEQFPDLARLRPELVAHHLSEAGEAEQAVEAWQTAGDFAAARAALMEANRHYNKALEILRTLPDTPERAQMELPIQISAGQNLSAIKGFGSAEEAQAFARAREIAGQLDDSPQFFFILLGLWSTTNSRSEIKASKELSNELLRIAERDQTPLLEVWAHLTQAIEAYAVGNFSGVAEHVERLQSYYNPDDHTWAPFDPYVTVLGHATYALWQLGNTEQALQKAREQLAFARQLSPANVAMARMTTCNLSMYLNDADSLMSAAHDMLEIGEEQQLPSFLAWGTMYKGIALILQKSNLEGMTLLVRGMGSYLASGTHSSLGWYLSRLAIGHAQSGDMDMALQTIEDALGAAPDETMHLPELYRLRADFLHMKGEPEVLEAVEKDYRRAITVSQQFNALAQELRAAIRLGRQLQSQGRAEEAQALLAPLYARFTEGFDTPDLVEARTLLDELAAIIPA